MNHAILYRKLFAHLGKPALTSVFFLFLFFVILPPAIGGVVPLEPSTQEPAQFIQLDKGKVRIDARGKTLKEVLEAVQSTSKIQFFASEELLQQEMTRAVGAPEWGKAVEKLLRGFNLFAFWSADGRMLQAFVLNSGADGLAISRQFLPALNQDAASVDGGPPLAAGENDGAEAFVAEEEVFDPENIAIAESEEMLNDVALLMPPDDESMDAALPDPPDETQLAEVPEELPEELVKNRVDSPVTSDMRSTDTELVRYREEHKIPEPRGPQLNEAVPVPALPAE